jgi:hypothetical protein
VSLLTKKEFVFVYKICDTEINGAEYQDEWLGNAIQESNHKDQDSLGIYGAVVDQGRRVQLGKVCWRSLGQNSMYTSDHLPLGVRVRSKRKKNRGMMMPKLRSCNGMIPSPKGIQLPFARWV